MLVGFDVAMNFVEVLADFREAPIFGDLELDGYLHINLGVDGYFDLPF